MKNETEAWFLIFLFTALLVVPSWQVVATPAAAPAIPTEGIFQEAPDGALALVSATPQTIRERLVTIDFAQLAAPAHPSTTLDLNLFADTVYTAQLERAAVAPLSGNQIWVGTLAGVPHSTVVLVYGAGLMQGQIIHPFGTYTVRYAGGDLHRISQIDSAAFIDHDTDPPLAVAEPVPGLQQQIALARQADSGAILDLMLVYSTSARITAGGTAAMQALLELGVAISNQAYRSSKVQQRLYLVHTVEVNYTETRNSMVDLTRLARVDDGYLDEIHPLRDEYHADFVAIVLDDIGNSCGLGYILTSDPRPSFEAWTFAVIEDDCIADNYSLTHELGHSMGLRHDWYVDAEVTPYSDAHGFVNRAGKWRTIMAYNNLCRDSNTSCTRLPYFANPAVQYEGVAMGVPQGSNTTCKGGDTTPNPETCDANTARVLNETSVGGAAYRNSQIVWTGSANTDWNDPANWRMAQGAFNAETVSRVPRAIDDVLIPAAPEGTRFPTLAANASVRDVLLESGARLNITAGQVTVFGVWEAQGSAQVDATAATLIFAGDVEQSLVTNAQSRFGNVQVGTDSTGTQLDLVGTLTLAGSLTINPGATLLAGSSEIRIAGDWYDLANGFVPDTGTVVMDGTTQISSAAGGNRLAFYNLTIGSTAVVQAQTDIEALGDVQVAGTLDLGQHTLHVEGAISNTGTLRQSRAVPADTHTAFLEIRNLAGDTIKYRGVDLVAADDMGITTVAVQGGQVCTNSAALVHPVQRCFSISPTTKRTAIVNFWYLPTLEGNGSTDPRPYRALAGGGWQVQPPCTKQASDKFRGTQAICMADFGTFALADDLAVVAPTATPTAIASPTTIPTVTTTPTATASPTTISTVTTTPTATASPTSTPTATTTPTPDLITANYVSGAPGSVFIIAAQQLPPNGQAVIAMQVPSSSSFRVLGTVPVRTDGTLEFALQTALSDAEGNYVVQIEVAPDAQRTITLTLDRSLPRISEMQDGIPILSAGHMVYLPLIRRGN